jgi:hypothetical protein
VDEKVKLAFCCTKTNGNQPRAANSGVSMLAGNVKIRSLGDPVK